MPKKKRAGVRKASAQAAEVVTSDDQTELPSRSLRPRCKAEARIVIQKLSSKYLDLAKVRTCRGQSDSENAYDADSELEQNAATESETDYEESRMDCVNVPLDNIVTDRTSIANPSNTMMGNKVPFVKFDKENITPPGSHSTPNVVQRAVRNLDDSLFGFNNLSSPLQVSPVRTRTHDALSPTSSSKCSTASITPGKRKLPKEDVDLVRNDNPKKRTRRKTRKEPLPQVDLFEEMREQFKIVDMHELVIEVD